jgi:hypothetical protein
MVASAAVDEFAKSFEEDFCFIVCMSSATVSDMWFVDNRVSCHMTGNKEFFTRLQEVGMNLVIELGDDMHYKAHVDDCSYVRHSPSYKPERNPLRGVCCSYPRQSWNVEMASSLQRVEKNSR